MVNGLKVVLKPAKMASPTALKITESLLCAPVVENVTIELKVATCAEASLVLFPWQHLLLDNLSES